MSKLAKLTDVDVEDVPVKKFFIDNIPAVLWGEKSSKLIIAVHGNLSNKLDVPISLLAEVAVPRGYQVLSFDLPQHGSSTLCRTVFIRSVA